MGVFKGLALSLHSWLFLIIYSPRLANSPVQALVYVGNGVVVYDVARDESGAFTRATVNSTTPLNHPGGTPLLWANAVPVPE
jgi:hypothetical protein